MALFLCMAMGMMAQSEEKKKQSYDLVTEGVNLYDEGKMEEALKKFDAALKLDKTYASTYYEKALALSALDKKKEAKKVLLESLKRCPEEDLEGNYKFLGDIVDDEGAHRQALGYYEKAIELITDGDGAMAQSLFYNMGVTYQRLAAVEVDSVDHHKSRAYNLFVMSLVRNPKHAGSYYGLYSLFIDESEAERKGGFSTALGTLGWYAFFGAQHPLIWKLAEVPEKWANINLSQEDVDSLGPRTRMAYESVRESVKKEPSEYGKLYDLLMYAIPKVAEGYTEEPVPLPLVQEDFHDEFLWPLYAKMVREEVLEAFCHCVAVRTEADYIANANWITSNKEATDKLVDMLNEGRYFDVSLREEQKYGKVPSVLEVASAEDAHARNEEAKLACIYYLNHYIGTEEMQQTAQFILNWTMVSPDVMIPIGEGESILLKEETQPFLLAYMAGCALIQLYNEKQGMDEDDYLSAVTDMLNYYNHNKDKTGEIADLERLYQLGISDYDAFVNEVKSKFPKLDNNYETVKPE